MRSNERNNLFIKKNLNVKNYVADRNIPKTFYTFYLWLIDFGFTYPGIYFCYILRQLIYPYVQPKVVCIGYVSGLFFVVQNTWWCRVVPTVHRSMNVVVYIQYLVHNGHCVWDMTDTVSVRSLWFQHVLEHWIKFCFMYNYAFCFVNISIENCY